ncbi:hypothetical protein [Stutzerimonas stutzeri]|uniref:hypothetical protein n=1 Tax=Stutzerimonas stutzeri TaxID=316 RepID=UPI0015E47DA6|nr:hypothetical protein [Stutzerimonas stutzeri]MBA1280233.1 hypothetical protein [Stutzerimonas stutzeri]
MRKPTLALTIALAVTGGALATKLIPSASEADIAPVPAAVASDQCSFIASEEQARSLLTRLFPNAQIITAEELSFDDSKTACMLEVDMLADASKPQSRGFVYVLPDGERFLNGPLMDKRSKVAIEPVSADIGRALKEQQEAIESIMSQRTAPQVNSQAAHQHDETDYSNQLASSFAKPTSDSEVPSIDDMRLKLVEKMRALPSLATGDGDKVVHVLVDPLCNFCKRLHQDSEELSAKHGIRFNWIPIFLTEGSWAMSSLVLKTAAISPADGAQLMDTMMQGKWGGPEAEAAVRALTEADYAAVKPAAGLFVELAKTNSRIGTPLVVFEKSSGGVEVISGLPTEGDWKGL